MTAHGLQAPRARSLRRPGSRRSRRPALYGPSACATASRESDAPARAQPAHAPRSHERSAAHTTTRLAYGILVGEAGFDLVEASEATLVVDRGMRGARTLLDLAAMLLSQTRTDRALDHRGDVDAALRWYRRIWPSRAIRNECQAPSPSTRSSPIRGGLPGG